jgi:hypothetical protein
MLRRQSDLLAIPDDPEYYTWSTQGRLAGVVTLLMTCALVAVLIRIYIRIFMLHVFRIDDYFIVAAVVCLLHFIDPFHLVRLTDDETTRYSAASAVASSSTLFLSEWGNTSSPCRRRTSNRCSCGCSSSLL